MKRTDHRGLGCSGRKPVVDIVNQHRNTQHVRKQHILLPLVVALLSGSGQKIDRVHPLLLRRFDFSDVVVDVANQSRKQLLVSWIFRRDRCNNVVGQFNFVFA